MLPASQCRCGAFSALLKNVDAASRREGQRHLLTTKTMSGPGPNAGLIIIGDEILRGQTRVSLLYLIYLF